MRKPGISEAAKTGLEAGHVANTVGEYTDFFTEGEGGDVAARKSNYEQMVNHYYDLVTDFYEYGWGHSFHFAPRFRHESFAESLRRHEYYLASVLRLGPGSRVLDVGCGVGGPMRNIARFSGASIVGLNNNDYQIERGRKHSEEEGLSDLCSFEKGDFTKLAYKEEFDAAYAIEATCHAPDRVSVFRGIYDALKPGGWFAGYEWCTTDRFDPADQEHVAIKRGIEEGDALPDLTHTSVVDDAIRASGFDLIRAEDFASKGSSETPWFLSLAGQEWSLRSLPRTPVGRFLSHRFVRLLELFRLAPKGSTCVSSVLNTAADALVEGGRREIFTPMYFFLAQKPASSK